jgi:hypothetical protein
MSQKTWPALALRRGTLAGRYLSRTPKNGHDRRARAADQLVKIVPWRERVAVEPRDNFAHQGYMTFLPGVDACCCAARRVGALRNVVRESSDRREF